MIRLICIDMDGVLTAKENFWLELHKALGTLEEGTKLTKAYLTTDYDRLVQEVVVRLWSGRDAAPYHELVNSVPFTPGIDEFFNELDAWTRSRANAIPRAILSGGCYDVALRVKEKYGIDFIFANQLNVKGGRIAQEFQWPVGAGGATKARLIEELCDDLNILPQEVLMIGDSDGDLDAFRIAGVSIAFNTQSEMLKAAATYVVDSSDLRDIVPVLRRIRDLRDV